MMSVDRDFLSVEGNRIVNGGGGAVTLRGIGLGGWMNMENFITGYPCNEEALREGMGEVLGPQLTDYFFDRFLEHFFSDADAHYLVSLGMNQLRIPLNYRHFEDDSEPMVIKESGFKHLDRVIDLCAKRRIYTIIDLHALPGYQNQDWHSDNPTHKELFWRHRHFQDRVVNLWEAFARRYRDNPWVAGYNLINEPAAPDGGVVREFYERLMQSVRVIDPNHLFFLDANRYSIDTGVFDASWPGVVYAVHDYPSCGQIDGGPYPGETQGRRFDRDAVEAGFAAKIRFMLDNNLPVWLGEFGPVYTGDSEKDAMRYQLLRDQLEMCEKYGASWSLWTYKDIGLQGLTFAKPECAYLRRIKPVLEKQSRLGANSWSTLDTQIRHVTGPLEKLFEEEFTGYNPFPFGAHWQITRLVRNILLSEPLLLEWCRLFRGMTEPEIEDMMQSFSFENCARRTALEEILRGAC